MGRYAGYAILFFAVLGIGGAGPATATERPVVVELFTSQGCNSCPPADRFLGELAQRPDVLPLAFHVTYWDHIGWRDPYGLHGARDRQEKYAWRGGRTSVYTPEMVVDGTDSIVGTYEDMVEDAIELAHDEAPPAVPISLSFAADGALVVDLGTSLYRGSADVLLVSFDPLRHTRVERGENRGRTLEEYNIVRGFEPIGVWSGGPHRLTVPRGQLPSSGEMFAVLVQSGGPDRYLGAATLARR